MKKFFRGLYYSLPLQLMLLHLKKFQVLLIFWYILFSTVNGHFMKSFGADSLFLAPEYLGKVNALAAGIVGIAVGIFFMSWNITTFILFSRHFRFLATTTNPFLKYCINNCILPAIFLLFYFVNAIHFGKEKELMTTGELFLQVLGFLGGLILLITASFVYFFRYDRSIIRQLKPVISNPQLFKAQFKKGETRLNDSRLIKVEWYLQKPHSLKKVRDVSHYSKEFIETIFGRHHFAAVLSIFIAFAFLVALGFMLDNPVFQLPAAASITVFFAILIAVSGAFSYFLQTWSIPFLIFFIVVLNILYRANIIDPSNKAYGLNYQNKQDRPIYNSESLMALCNNDSVEKDKKNMVAILEAWKKKQGEEKPLMIIISTSGGGNRSATFTMNVLQRLDSLTNHQLMKKTFLITGASGGMLGATYFRSLDLARSQGKSIDLQQSEYANDISGDLLNPLFSSLVARDLAAPAQKFKVGEYSYLKDRGYAFEQKLNENTRGFLDKQFRDLEADERNARMPLMIFNSVVTRDGRKMMVSTQPLRFMMKPVMDSGSFDTIDPDAIDFQSFFAKQNPMNLRLLTAMRMNATFPYVLPNVWLPTQPVVDVMDAGLRDNFGIEGSLRFLQVFREWIKENTGGVVLIQIRDRKSGGWEHPFESNDVSEVVSRPLLLLQYNWHKMQEYNQNDLLSLSQEMMGTQLHKLTFQYAPKSEETGAALNFHLTRMEKKAIADALFEDENKSAFSRISSLLK